MFRVSDLIDLPVKTLKDTANPKHTVKSVLLDGKNNKAAALVCKEGTIKKYCKIIPYEKIIAIDINGVIIPDESCIRKVSSKELNGYIKLDDIVNKSVISVSDGLQGTLTDLYLNLLTGQINNLEISEGYLDDLVEGRKTVSLEQAMKDNISVEGNDTFLKSR